jgi:hypothetical protein
VIPEQSLAGTQEIVFRLGTTPFNANLSAEEALLQELCKKLGFDQKTNTLETVLSRFKNYTIVLYGRGVDERVSAPITDSEGLDAEMGASEMRVSFSGTIDLAEAAKKGGIDFAQSNLDMQIKRDGAGVVLPTDQQDLDSIHLEGLVPVILNIQPATSLP